MANLDKSARDALPDSDFAVPGKRKLPMHDATHTVLAWGMIDRAVGLSDAEKRAARESVKSRADSLGVDTSDWHIAAHCSFEAMALLMPDVDGHPNKMPFKGVLTRVDQASDKPPGGAKGKRTWLSSEVAECALPSLLGMAVDFTPDFDGHDRKSKIGLITSAAIVGDGVEIEGFFYAKDFPAECQQIRTEKGALGFSFEADARIQDVGADVWVIDHCVFTGAAVLYKDMAAYQTTSLAAKAELDIEMTKEEMQALLAAAITPLSASIEKQGAELAAVQKAVLEAGKGASLSSPLADQVRPHIDTINAAADALEKSGMGANADGGHARHLRHIAAHMAAEAASGRVPSVYRVDAAAAPAVKDDGAAAKVMADLAASVADLGTKFTDLQAKAFNHAAEPQRATISPAIKSLLAKASIKEEDIRNGKLSVDQVNAMLDAAGIKGTKAMETKLNLRASGLMPAGSAT